MEADHGGVLDPDVLEGGEPRIEFAAGVVGELGEGMLEASLLERGQLRGEAEEESGVADGGELRQAVVAVLEGAGVALELDAEAQDHHPEEGDGVDLALATDESGLVGERFNQLGGEEAGERLLDRAGFRWTGRRGPVGCVASHRGGSRGMNRAGSARRGQPAAEEDTINLSRMERTYAGGESAG